MRYAFSDCILDTDDQTLTRKGVSVRVEPQVFDLLHLLIGQAGKLVSRDQIVDAVWNGRIVSDSAISARIAAARKAVGDDGKEQRVIQTVSRRGLRFVAALDQSTDAPQSGTIAANLLSDTPPRTRFVRAADGTTLAYSVAGSGPPLLLVPYFPSDMNASWSIPTERALFDVLSSKRTLVRFDHRGSGMSERNVQDFGIKESAEDICTVMDAAGFDKFAIYSESGGSLVALTFAATHPDRVTRLAMSGAYAEGRLLRGKPKSPEADVIRTLLNEGFDAHGNAFLSAFMTAYFPEGPSDAVMHCAVGFQRNAPQELVLKDRDMINSTSVLGLLDRITAPVLLFHGARDSVHPLPQAQKLAAGLRNAELIVYDTANHVPLPGHPTWERFVPELLEFLSRD